MKNEMTFEDFYRAYYFRTLRYIQGHISVLDEAEDLTHEVFEYCFKRYNSFDPEKSSLSTWLFVVINSRMKNYYRGRREMEDICSFEDVLPSEADDIERTVYLAELKDRLLRALGSLPERQRVIVTERFFYKHSHAEIAARLNITESNSRVLLNRALAQLKEQMQDYAC